MQILAYECRFQALTKRIELPDMTRTPEPGSLTPFMVFFPCTA